MNKGINYRKGYSSKTYSKNYNGGNNYHDDDYYNEDGYNNYGGKFYDGGYDNNDNNYGGNYYNNDGGDDDDGDDGDNDYRNNNNNYGNYDGFDKSMISLPYDGCKGEWIEREVFDGQKSFGFYECSKCFNTWLSSKSFKDYRQGCKYCNKDNYPLYLWKNETKNIKLKPKGKGAWVDIENYKSYLESTYCYFKCNNCNDEKMLPSIKKIQIEFEPNIMVCDDCEEYFEPLYLWETNVVEDSLEHHISDLCEACKLGLCENWKNRL